jgi:CheY-like chemotaxis protein
LEQYQILLVDDSRSDAQIFEAALKEASPRARVYWVETGKEALEFLRQRGRFQGVGSVRVVILDLHLQSEDGLSILRDIKSDPHLNRKPVVLFTSEVSQDEIDLAYSLGANAYFRKPITLESYIEHVRVLAQHWLDVVQLPSDHHRPHLNRDTAVFRAESEEEDR